MRLEFTNKTKRSAYQRSGGFCECARVPMLNRPLGCGMALTDGRVRYEHVVPAELTRDNSLDNCAALSIACWRQKTNEYDLPIIAKSNRVRDRAHGISKPTSRPMPGGRDSDWKKTFNNGWVRR